jgi:hypothetical protein
MTMTCTDCSRVLPRSSLRFRAWIAAVAAPMLAFSGCTASSDDMSERAVRDSAGITIVESRLPASDRLRIEPLPVVTIGESEGEEPYLLSYVRSVLMLDDGRILIADGSDRRIRIFDANGVYLESFGGSGQGPGEFGGSIQSILSYRGDSIAVVQLSGRPIHIFDGSGQYGRRVVPQYDFSPSPTRPPSSGCCRVLASFPDGGWLVEYPEVTAQEGPELRRGESQLVRVSAEGEVVADIGTFPGSLRHEVTAELRRMGFAGSLFSLLLRGDFVAAVNGDRILVGGDGEFRVDELGLEGRLVRSLRIDVEPAAFTAEDQQAYADAYRRWIIGMDGMILPVNEAVMRAQFENLPDRVPAYQRIMTDPAGRIWLSSSAVPLLLYGAYRALVLDSDGAVLGDVEFPPGFAPRQVGRDRVLGLVTDSMGVSRVMVHRVVASSGSH